MTSHEPSEPGDLGPGEAAATRAGLSIALLAGTALLGAAAMSSNPVLLRVAR